MDEQKERNLRESLCKILRNADADDMIVMFESIDQSPLTFLVYLEEYLRTHRPQVLQTLKLRYKMNGND